MAQISYGTITITDTTDLENVFLIYKGSSSNTTAPSIIWSGDTNDWKTDITQVTGDYIWAITVFKYTGILITSSNYTDYYSDPVCLTGESGTSISITSIKYSTATTSSKPADSTFTLTNPPDVPEGEWLWSRTLFSNGQSVYSKAKQGQKGEQGEQGEQGERGISILKITTAPTTYTTTTGGFTPSYRVSLSTVKTQSGQSKVLVGDIIEYDSNHYRVGYIDSSYVYLGPSTSIKGASGQSYYTYIRYADDANGTNMSSSPTGKTYIGVYAGTSSTAPSSASSYAPWMKYIGTDGQPGSSGVSVTQVRELYYLTTGNAPSKPTVQTTIYDYDVIAAWTSVVPEYINNGKYYISLETTLSNSTKVWSNVVLDQALTDANYNAAIANSISQSANENANGALSQASEANYKTDALDAKLKYFFYPGDSNYPGVYAVSGINNTPFNESNIATYGFNVALKPANVAIGYNTYKALELDGSIPALKLYKPSKISQGAQTAQLDSNGLVLSEGGIRSGDVNAGNSGFVYLSTKNYGSNLTINGHQASNWREVIGTKFGVDADGNLYASNADISGKITVGSGSNVSTTDEMNSAIGDAIDDIEIGGRNYITLASHFGQENTTNGGTTKVLSDSTIVANGTFTATTLVLNTTILTGVQLEAGTYQLWATNPNFCHFRLGTTTSGTYWKEGDYSKDSPCKITVSTSQYVTIGITVSAGTYSNEATRIMLEKGTMVTDWTPAPEDVQAEIDAKKNIHTLTSSNTNGAEYTTILGWCAEDATGSWSVTSTAGVKTGDTVRIAYKVSNMGTADDRPVVYCIGTVTNVWSETSLQMISHGLDSTVIDGGHILTGTIDASKVNVTNLNANNISGGTLNINYIPADARNSNISIGGENLLKDNSYLYLTSYNCAILKLTENLVAGQTYTLQLWGISFTNTPNTNNFIGVYLGGGSQSLGSITSFSNGYGYLTFTPTAANIAHADSRRGFIYLYNTTPSDSKTSRQITITKWKLEKGNKPTDWSPAPSDRAGNANLLRGTMQMLDGAGSYASGTFRASGGTLSHGTFGAGSEVPVNGLTGFIRTQNYTSSATSVGIAQDGIPAVDIRTGTFFTLSCWVRGTAGVEVYLQPLWKSATQHAGNSPSAQRRVISNIWSFIQYTGVLVGDQITDGISGGYVYGYNVPVNGYVDICGLKLEVGSAASGWNTGIGSDMVTRIDDNGIYVHPMGTIANRIEINANGFNVYKADTMRVSVNADTIRLRSPNGGFPQVAVDANEAWFAYSANDWATLNSSGFNIVKSGTSVAFYGDNARIGKDGKERVIIDASGVGIYDKNNYRRATFDATGIRLYGTNYSYPTVDVNATSSGVYLDANNYTRITSSGLDVVKGGTNVANFSTSARIGATTVGNKYVVITSSGLYVRKQVDASTTKDYLTLTDGWCCFGDPAASRITCNTTGDSPYFYMNAGGQNALYADATGVKVGNYDTNYSYIKSDGLHVYQASTDVAFFGATARIGKDKEGKVVITNSGIDMYGYDANASPKQQLLCHIGYGNCVTNEGTAYGPYYSFGLGRTWESGTNGLVSMAEGYSTKASGFCAHAEGFLSEASKTGAHAEGSSNATAAYAHAEGDSNASGEYSHAEGSTNATANYAHSEGYLSSANGVGSHAEGNYTRALGNYSHTSGVYTSTGYEAQFAIGKYNRDDSDYIFMVGNGSSSKNSNAFAVTKSGTIIIGDHSSSVGSVLRAKSSVTSLANDTATALCNLSIPAGTWILVGKCRFGGKAGNVRRLVISTTSADVAFETMAKTDGTGTGIQVAPGTSSAAVQHQVTHIVSVTANTTFYFNAWHNAGSALAVAVAQLEAVRIC